ncbi:MAG: hypothetical protein U5L09_18885 [Bacteroidales bacterium]|nr:hypothetical protein [Bacteroidales bacterium]
MEIPAIPEDYEMMKDLMKEMKEAGVTFLNLHQIRVTDFNYPKLKARGYTILHGPKRWFPNRSLPPENFRCIETKQVRELLL